MDQKNTEFQPSDAEKPKNLSDSMLIGAGAFVVGYVIGAGKWDWFGRETSKIAGSLGALAWSTISQSVQNQYPQWFGGTGRTIH
jgi:hypothetical protein